MNDKEMAALFMAQVLPVMQTDPALVGVKLARNFQPRMHGASNAPYVYFFKIGEHRHGSPLRKEVWNATNEAFDHIETQICEDTYQFSAWIPQDPANVTALTESDILSTVAGIMQSDVILAAFRAQGVGVMRITDVRNPYIVDDRDQFAAKPNFDVAVTHSRTKVSTVAPVVSYELNINRI